MTLVPWIPFKEPYIPSKEPYISEIELNLPSKEPYIASKDPYIPEIELNLPSKEPFFPSKEPCFLTGALYSLKRETHCTHAPTFWCACPSDQLKFQHNRICSAHRAQKNFIFPQMRNILLQKSPINPQKSPKNALKRAHIALKRAL